MSRGCSALRVILTGFFRDRVDVFAVQRFDSLDAAVAKVRSGDFPAVVAQQGDVSLVTALAQAALFVGVAVTPPFGLRLSDQWWLAIPLLLVGTLSCLSIGLLVGAIARTEEAAQAMANLVVLPMAFLSGTFFDVSQLPPWLRTASNALALTLPRRACSDGTTPDGD